MQNHRLITIVAPGQAQGQRKMEINSGRGSGGQFVSTVDTKKEYTLTHPDVVKMGRLQLCPLRLEVMFGTKASTWGGQSTRTFIIGVSTRVAQKLTQPQKVDS